MEKVLRSPATYSNFLRLRQSIQGEGPHHNASKCGWLVVVVRIAFIWAGGVEAPLYIGKVDIIA